MTISQTQIVDYFNKKIGSGLAKTDLSTAKSPSNETIPSPLLVPGSTIWQQDSSIAYVSVLPTSNSSVVTIYSDSLSSSVQATRDNTASGTNQTWLTNLIDWIPSSLGTGYQIKLYAAPAGASSPQTTGVALPQAGSGNNDAWTFDYQSGVINFADTNVPTAVTWNGTTGNVVYAVGARYTGPKGISNFANLQIGSISANTISSPIGNVAILSNLYVYGNIKQQSNAFIQIAVGTTQQRPTPSNLGMVRYNTTISSFEGYGAGNAWSSLGGVKSVDGFAYITAEAYAGAGDDVLRFYSGSTGSSVQAMWVSTSNVTILSNLMVSNAISAMSMTGNITADTITPNYTPVTVFNSNTAIGLPSGTTADRPQNPVDGYFRYNTDNTAVEVYTNSAWLPITNEITSQVITGDGVNSVFTLNQAATATGIIVSINGTVQQPNVAYTVVNDQITFAEIPVATDVVDVRFISSVISFGNQVAGNLTITGLFAAPATTKASTDPGIAGQICWDANYIYVCTATNTWKRTSLTGGY